MTCRYIKIYTGHTPGSHMTETPMYVHLHILHICILVDVKLKAAFLYVRATRVAKWAESST